MEPPHRTPEQRLTEIRRLVSDYLSASGRPITRAAIAEVLIERELPWLLEHFGASPPKDQ
jgi:hypothetical protein